MTETDNSQTLGTFGGVFTPSLLTILGLVLFLRLGFVTGNVGVANMMVIFGLATSVSLLTTLSLAAIATNLNVGGGGVYYLISRTLGPSFGGAIGVVLYLAMSVSVAFYAIGLGEAVARTAGTNGSATPRIIAAAVIVALLGVAWLGADIATRFQYVVMACLAVALLGYFVGVLPDLSTSQLADNMGAPEGGLGFWTGFALFFPAITGFTQGVAMSGDLRTPGRSITIGTFGAVALSSAVYLAVIVTFAMAVPLEQMREDTSIMRGLALTPALIDIGVIAATLSSAIASILGAPRTLQRLAADRLIKPLQPFAHGAGQSNNPRRATLLTTAIALLTVVAGDLDTVAPAISMFFLASYGMINFATYSEARSANIGFRPTFRWFDWRLSLLGTIACLGVIIAIDPLAGGFAGGSVYALYRYLRRSVREVRWADSTVSFHAAEVRTHLQSMSEFEASGRDWRPCTVAFAPRDPARRSRLISVASWLEGGAGFTTAARIISGKGPVARRHAAAVRQRLRAELSRDHPSAYARVIVAPDLCTGVAAILQIYGIGPVRANLALFHWQDVDTSEGVSSEDDESMLQTAIRFGCNTAVLMADDERWGQMQASNNRKRRIVVWWAEDDTGQLLTLLAWMCTRDSIWQEAEIDVHVAQREAGDVTRVAKILADARLPIHGCVPASSGDFVSDVAGGDLVFAPLRIRGAEALGPSDIPLGELVGRLPVTLLARVAEPVDLDIQPDEADVAALAEARDRAMDATARADELDRLAGSLMVKAEMMRIELAANDGADPPLLDDAAAKAAAAYRTYLDARARADEAWRLVREIDPNAESDQVTAEMWIDDPGASPT